MIKSLAVSAATFIALTLSLSPARACDEDCAYEANEAAYERAEERASAREEAAEEGYYYGSRSSGAPRRREQAAARAAQAQKAAAQSSESRRAQPKPEPAPSTQIRSPRTKVAKENSSISTETGSNRLAEEDSYERPAKAVGCKKYIASAGMTLSVPCE